MKRRDRRDVLPIEGGLGQGDDNRNGQREATMDTHEGPESWQVAEALMGNLREAQDRARSDVLRFAVVGALFLVLRAAASSVSFAGIDIANPRIVEYAVVPYAAFLAMRFAKAQRLSDTIETSLVDHLVRAGPNVPSEAMPIDWGLSRNRSAATGISLGKSHLVTPVVMVSALIIALGISWYDALDRDDLVWCILATVATLLVGAATLQGRRYWGSSFFGARHAWGRADPR